MPKIIIMFDSTYGDAYYKGLGKTLQEYGNDIFYANIHDLHNINHLMETIEKFNGDILITYNNRFPYKYKKKLPKIILSIDVDTPANFENKSEFLNDFLANKRYYSSIQSCYPDLLKTFFPKIKNISNAFWLPAATDFYNKQENFQRNILFVGTNWNYDLYNSFEKLDIKTLKHLNKVFDKNYFISVKNELKQLHKPTNLCSDFCYKWNTAGLKRVEYLSMLTDLGLEVYGDRWDKLIHNPDVLKTVRNQKICNSQKLNYLYNTSKICVNFSHPQAITAFSFRCMDIMASASCLLTEYKPDFSTLFGEYISDEVKNAIFYNNRFDLREKAQRLLNDDNLRNKCVQECNYAIEKNGRWKHRIPLLENALNISLKSNNRGVFYNYSISKKNIQNDIPINNKIKKISKYTCRTKIFFYSFLLALSQLPIIYFLIRSKKKDKLLGKINKYWR